MAGYLCISRSTSSIWAGVWKPIVQMPGGVPVGTLAIGTHGAKNSALLAVRILANSRPDLREKFRQYHAKMAEHVKNDTLG